MKSSKNTSIKMTLVQFINQKLETIKFSNKTKILITIILSGTMTIGFLMFVSIFALKYDYETLFQKHTLPQVDLEEIKDIYRVNISETLSDIKDKQISSQDAIEVIYLSQQIIRKQWQSYQKAANMHIGGVPYFASRWLSLFLVTPNKPEKNVFQQGIVEKISLKMDELDAQITLLIDRLKAQKTQEAAAMIDSIMLSTNSLNIYLSSLITSHLKQSISEKQINDSLFQTSTYMLILLIGMIFFFITMVLLIIINHFKNIHNYLEENIAEKTHELRDLNNSLEQRIKREVENSRKKDNIMFQQARLASLGEMLQNIAHQWRQPLGSLMMIIQSFESKFYAGKLDEAFVSSRVKDAELLSSNMSETLEDFRTFFNPNKSKKTFHIQDVIQKAIDLSKYQLEKEEITLRFFIRNDIEAFGFKNELIHVLLNLIGNSKDILAGKTELNEKIIHIISKQNQESIFVNVIDNGGGIKSDIIPKVFDPYFTTKHKSVGTGIGLYMSKQMVEKHMHGKITCKNLRHKLGTKDFFDCTMFTIEIPKKQIDLGEAEDE
ncbi:sensor histidine kinase [Sulfurospirillum sp. hDNRA2]|uniref:sensor histidine kinase n=1 Tax=Sulfurospirillum sp. hDNRA2 TaxID=3237298 RepID=UPI0020B8ECB7|nr:HAMP domain-containing sensor histidine kinase [Sulfurospirillum sp. DNRA8]MCP3652840.1 HAMP domain-containing histidine kinase [Sulfurospirillum sp. DNRA8]MCR1811692.1 HAMP domain-containing histidine kinase [Sulfurospirillum sp. DNRA8]